MIFGATDKMPNAQIAIVTDQGFVDKEAAALFNSGINLLVGIPGAYTPICTNDHVPSLIKQADTLKEQGIENIYCISDDHCWALDSWRRNFSGQEKLIFLSDGNRDFLKKIRMESNERHLYIAGKYMRFYALIQDGRIKKMRAERTVLKTTATCGESILTDVCDFFALRSSATG